MGVIIVPIMGLNSSNTIEYPDLKNGINSTTITPPFTTTSPLPNETQLKQVTENDLLTCSVQTLPIPGAME